MIKIICEKEIACDSLDYLNPKGTRKDNSRNRRFNVKLYNLFPDKIAKILDIGCSGGGFVNDCIDDGHIAVGLEGSDYSKKMNRASWAVIPNALFTCDISKDFSVLNDGKLMKFDVITAWEVLEHIKKEDLPQLFNNIKKHLEENGFFIGSISTFPDVDSKGNIFHQTVESKEWWLAILKKQGFYILNNYHDYFNGQYIRGPKEEEGSFNVVLGLTDKLPQPPRQTFRSKLLDRWIGSKAQRYLNRFVTGNL